MAVKSLRVGFPGSVCLFPMVCWCVGGTCVWIGDVLGDRQGGGRRFSGLTGEVGEGNLFGLQGYFRQKLEGQQLKGTKSFSILQNFPDLFLEFLRNFPPGPWQKAYITSCDLSCQILAKMPKIITSHDVLEPLKQVLSASCDLIIFSQITLELSEDSSH